MKRYIKSAIILLSAFSLVGCSKTEEFQYNSDSALQIESVSGISPFSLMQEPASKAVISGETLPVDEAAKGIGLFVTASDGGAYDGKTTGYSNMKYTYSSAKWSAASPIYLSNTTGKLYGYFPYNVDATDLTAIPVASSLNGTDYLYATKQDVSFSNKSVNLQMNHALARLHLTIKKGDKYLSDCNLTKIVLQSKAIDANGTMNITTGAVTATKAADATGTVELTGTDAVTASGIEKDILLVPASTAEGKKDLTLTLTIDGIEAKVNFTGDTGLDIRQGIQNNVTITIEDTGVKITGVGVGVWGEGGSQTVQVSGHKVAVKRSDETGIANDVFLDVTSDGSSAIIKTLAATGRFTKCTCTPDGKATCSSSSDKTTGVCTFTISDVQEDITAEVGYMKCNVTVVYDSAMGIVKVNGDDVESENPVQFFGNDEVPFLAEAKSGYGFVKWTNSNDETLSTDNPHTISHISSDITLKAVFAYQITADVKPAGAGTVTGAGIYAYGSTVTLTATAGVSGWTFKGWAKKDSPGTIISTNNPYSFTVSGPASYVAVFDLTDALPGLFTVNSSGTQVRFSKGNLWCDGTGTGYSSEQPVIKSWGFESNQYYSTPTSEVERSINHISHFMWCKSAAESVKETYSETGTGSNDKFFTDNDDFAVNGISVWRTLTGGSSGEWDYLLNTRTMKYSKSRYTTVFGVSIEGVTCNGLFIYPDDYNGNEIGSGGPGTWADINAAGIVFLPAAGYRKGNPGYTYSAVVSAVGSFGYYWSASPYDSDDAYYLFFYSGYVLPSGKNDRYLAFSVRLVTEYE